MSLDTRTLTTRLITDTTATVSMNTTLTYSYKNRTGLRNTYSVFGLIVSLETTKQRGWIYTKQLFTSRIKVIGEHLTDLVIGIKN